MIWMLWYRLSKKYRIVFLAVPGLSTSAALTLFFVGLNSMSWVNQMHIMSAWVIPAAVLILLLIPVTVWIVRRAMSQPFYIAHSPFLRNGNTEKTSV